VWLIVGDLVDVHVGWLLVDVLLSLLEVLDCAGLVG